MYTIGSLVQTVHVSGDSTVNLGLGVPVKPHRHQVAVPLVQEGSGHGFVDANVVRGPLGVGHYDAAVFGHPGWWAIVIATDGNKDGGAEASGADGAEERDRGLLVLLEGDDVGHQQQVSERAVGVNRLVGKAEHVGGAVSRGAGVCRASSVENSLASWAGVQTPVCECHHCVCVLRVYSKLASRIECWGRGGGGGGGGGEGGGRDDLTSSCSWAW